MVLDDRHISYLRLVEAGNEATNSDSIVAAMMLRLGLTHIVVGQGVKVPVVALTPRGIAILLEEDEAWA